MNINGYEISEWKVSNIGATAIATRDGKKYFLKKYGQYKRPREADVPDKMTPKGFEKKLKAFNDFKEYREKINSTLASFAGTGGNIKLPCDWFVYDINYTEATEFVDGVLSNEQILALSQDDLLLIMKTAASAMYNVHKMGIVHSDIKLTNILVATNTAGKPVAKIIDFDRSYFVENIRPDDIGGDQSYMSPELTMCFATEFADEYLAKLSDKSDIFSLGLVFYNYLTQGEFPKMSTVRNADGEEMSFSFCGEACLNGAKLKLSEKLKKPYIAHLIANMLQTDPSKRPSAFEVLEALKGSKILPLPSDSNVEIPASLRKDEASTSSVGGGASTPTPARPTPAPAPAPTPSPTIPTGYCEPWPEHSFKFDEEKMRAKGYVAAVQHVKNGVKCYLIWTTSGATRVLAFQTIKLFGLGIGMGGSAPSPVRPTPAPTPAPAPAPVIDMTEEMWPSDKAYTFDNAAIAAQGYVKVEKAINNGKECYVLISANGTRRNINISMLKILKLVKLK